MTATTLSDYGRYSEKYGEVPFYYTFKIKFYFQDPQVVPDDVQTWCQENCKGYYRVQSYTHKSSTSDHPVRYCEKVYLQEEQDAMIIKLMFNVSEQWIKLPKATRKKRKSKKR